MAVVPLLTLVGIARHGVNAPYADQWTMTSLFRDAAAGTLDFGDFWAQHNEHRPLFPRAIDFGLAYLTKWDIRVELYVDFAIAAATFAVILIALRRSLEDIGLAGAAVVSSAIFFSPAQWENWLWGWELEWFLSNLAALGALWSLTFVVGTAPGRGLTIAAASGVVATFSLGHGLLIWPVGLVLLLLRRRPWRIWTVISIAVTALYLVNYDDPGHHPSKTIFLEQPVKLVAFVCLYLGRQFANSRATGVAVGAAIVVTFTAATAYVVWNRADRDLLDRAQIWIGLGLYSLGAAVTTGISRLGFGVGYATSSRYSVMGALFAICTMALLLILASKAEATQRMAAPRMRYALTAAITLPLLLAALVNARHGFHSMERFGNHLDALAACTRHARTSTDPCLARSGLRKLDFPGILLLRSRAWAGYSNNPMGARDPVEQQHR